MWSVSTGIASLEHKRISRTLSKQLPLGLAKASWAEQKLRVAKLENQARPLPTQGDQTWGGPGCARSLGRLGSRGSAAGATAWLEEQRAAGEPGTLLFQAHVSF